MGTEPSGGSTAPSACVKEYHFDEAGGGLQQTASWTMADGELRERIVPGSAPVAAIGKRIGAAFLPHGYPASVTEDYLGFQVWDTVQGLCSYIRGMLTSQAILTGVGVGQQSATPLSAVFQFFVRDFLGMLGGIVFTASQGSSLDRCAKQWRFFADLMNNVGLLLELAAPHFPRAFLLLVSLGSVARSITGVAAGATRAALTQHFALRGNAADISAKEGSQETAVTLLGMVLGIGITHCTAGSTQLAWAVFAALTVLHIYANRNAVRALVLTALNEPRLRAILQVFQDTGEVPSPAELPAFEPLLPFALNPLAAAWRMPLRLGASVRQARRFPLSFSNSTPAEEATDPRPPSAQPFPLCLAAAHAAYHRTSEPFLALLSGDSVVVLLSPGIGTPDLLRAFVHGHTLQLHAQNGGRSALRSSPSAVHAVHTAAAQHAAVLTRTLLPRLEERGWNTSKVQLPVGGFRCRW